MQYLNSPHLALARLYWQQLIEPGDTIIDATCGNGKDSLTLGKLVLTESAGNLYCIDIQDDAIKATRALLQKNLPESHLYRVFYSQSSHERLPFPSSSVKGVVYNLGYLPGGDHAITTKAHTTIKSLQEALRVIDSKGFVSMTCYPGHNEGLEETKLIIESINKLSSLEYQIILLQQPNKKFTPKLIIIVKK